MGVREEGPHGTLGVTLAMLLCGGPSPGGDPVGPEGTVGWAQPPQGYTMSAARAGMQRRAAAGCWTRPWPTSLTREPGGLEAT